MCVTLTFKIWYHTIMVTVWTFDYIKGQCPLQYTQKGIIYKKNGMMWKGSQESASEMITVKRNLTHTNCHYYYLL